MKQAIIKMNKKLKQIKRQNNVSRILIIALIIWNLFLTLQPANTQTKETISKVVTETNNEIKITEFEPPQLPKLPPIGF